MTTKNKYIIHARISEAKFRELVKYFSLDIEAIKIAQLARINRNTVNRYLKLIRVRIAEYCESTMPLTEMEAVFKRDELMESLQSEQNPNKCRIYLGIIQNQDKIFTELICENQQHLFLSNAKNCQGIDCFSNFNRLRGYCGIVDFKWKKLFCFKSNGKEKNNEKDKASRPEIFWAFAKSRLFKFNGISKSTIYLHLKECEFRFNYRNEDIYKLLLEIIRKKPLK